MHLNRAFFWGAGGLLEHSCALGPGGMTLVIFFRLLCKILTSNSKLWLAFAWAWDLGFSRRVAPYFEGVVGLSN